MESTTQDQGAARKSTYADRLTKEMAARKPEAGLAAMLSKLNPFAIVTANK
jgi:hypothetical protein